MMHRRSALGAAAFTLALFPVATIVACNGDTTTDSSTIAVTSEEAQALSGAQESYGTQKAEISACIVAFESCKAQPSADVAACQTALHDCLPDTPPPPPRCGGRDGRGEAGHPPPRPSGSAPPPSAAPPPSGDRPAPSGSTRPDCDGGPGEGRPRPPMCEKLPLPAREALAACHDALTACIEAGTDRAACFDTERTCVKAAFQAAFEARCASLPETAPAEARARCAEGIEPTTAAN